MIVGIIGCILIMFFLQMATPFWWWIMVVPFVYGTALAPTALRGLAVGILSSGLLWTAGALFYFCSGGGIITGRMSAMISAPVWLIITAIILIGAVSGGLSALCGYYLRRSFQKSKS
jgi:hypothetical protein